MNSRQKKTLAAIFETPTRSDVEWSAIESLLLALGGEIKQGRGSRVRFTLNGQDATLHSPHPARVTGQLTVRDVKAFLLRAGVTTEEEP